METNKQQNRVHYSIIRLVVMDWRRHSEEGQEEEEEEEEQVVMESWLVMLHLFLSHTHTHRCTHMENWRSLASMLRCLMHILVRAEPMSLVPPADQRTRQSVELNLYADDSMTSSTAF